MNNEYERGGMPEGETDPLIDYLQKKLKEFPLAFRVNPNDPQWKWKLPVQRKGNFSQ